MRRPAYEHKKNQRVILRRVATRCGGALYAVLPYAVLPYAALLVASACGAEGPSHPLQNDAENPAQNGMDEANDDAATDDGYGPDTEDPVLNTPDPMQTLLSEYRDWQPRTDAPINVSSDIFTLCRAPTLAENAFTDSEHGQDLMLMDWLNPAARAGFEALGEQAFAAGAAIVKEKLAYRAGSVEPVLVAIGMMLKHEPGFDAEHGDWEFAYWEESPGLIDGPDQSAYCADCHASSPTDFVFLDDTWRDSTAPE